MANQILLLILIGFGLFDFGILFTSDRSTPTSEARDMLGNLDREVAIELGSLVDSLSSWPGTPPRALRGDTPYPADSIPAAIGVVARLDPKTGLIMPIGVHARRSMSLVGDEIVRDPQWAMVDLMRQAQEFNVKQATELRLRQAQQDQDQARDAKHSLRLNICNTTIAVVSGAVAIAALVL